MKKYVWVVVLAAIFSTACTNYDVVTNRKLSSEERSMYKLVQYQPLTKKECTSQKGKLGLKFCPINKDYLAGAALACGGLDNIPRGDELQQLARKVYNKNTDATTIYGKRNDKMLKEMGIYVEDSHIYYWAGEEASDGKGGYVRMFASKGSIPYYAPRDGSGYVSRGLGKVKYGDTKNIVTRNPERDSNLAGLPNNDVLLTIWKNNK